MPPPSPVGVGAGAVTGAAIAAGGGMTRWARKRDVPSSRSHAITPQSRPIHNGIEGEISMKKLTSCLTHWPYSVQYGVAGAVGGGAGELRDAPAVIAGHAAKGADRFCRPRRAKGMPKCQL